MRGKTELFKPSNDDIYNALHDNFKLEVYYGLNDEIKDRAFFSYLPTRIIEPNRACIWQQAIDVYYISMKEEDLKERKIYEVLKSIKLQVTSIDYDRVGLVDKNAFFDIVKFSCIRSARFL